MKRYLLLAATAMLFSTNAMATTYPDLDGQTADIKVSANIIPVCQLEVVDDTINFGILYADNTAESLSVSYDPSENVQCSGCVGVDATNSQMARVRVKPSCYDLMSSDFAFSCLHGGTPNDGCNIGSSGYTIAPSTFSPQWAEGDRLIGGNLSGPIPTETVELDSLTAFRITIDYQ